LVNTQIYILDACLTPVPVGVPGELYIGGDGLARGYHNRPELTAEKFVANPFSDDPNDRLYKTGDLVRYLPNGNLEYLGRLDHQVKLRGYRIELGEIESVLNRHQGLQESVVVIREDNPGDKRLVAYAISENENPPPVNELRQTLQEALPDYMVPAAFVFLETLPLTPNGKVDRGALPAPNWGRPQLEEKFVAPDTEIEIILADIWLEILQVERVGIYDNFFELGGHSLLVTQVMARVNEIFQIDLPLRIFFEAPSISSLATVIEERLIVEIDSLTEEQAEQLVKGGELK
jgi:acyl carrier protein